MQITETKKEKLTRHYKVIVPANDINKSIDEKLEKVGQNIKIPGFRAGKVPLTVLRQRYRREVLSETLQDFANDAGQKIISDHQLESATQPRINLDKFDDNDDLEFSVIIDLKPDIKLGDLSRIKAEKLTIKIDDKDVEAGLQSLAEESGTSEPITEKRACKEGDEVTIDFKGFKDGVVFEGGEAKEFALKLGSKSMIPGFEEGITGKKVGDEFRITVTFPENYQAENLAGATTEFDIKLHKISAPVATTIDDELAKKYGQKDLDELKKALKANMSERYQGSISRIVKRQIFDSIEGIYKYDLPENMVEAEFQSIWQQIQQIRDMGQIDPEDVDKSNKELETEYRAIAERRLRMAFFIDKYCAEHKIEATEQEIEQLIRVEAMRNPEQAKEINEYYQKNPQMRQNLASPILEEKAINHLLEKIDATAREITPEELTALEKENSSDGRKKSSGKKSKKETKKDNKKPKKENAKKPTKPTKPTKSTKKDK